MPVIVGVSRRGKVPSSGLRDKEVRTLRGLILVLLAVSVLLFGYNCYRRRHEARELGPSTERQSPPPLPKKLIDFQNFKFEILDNQYHDGPVLWAAFINSATYNFYHRRMIRDTWGKNQKVVFLLGKGNSTLQSLIEDEAQEFGDIVQGNFVDSYRNLTYKHAMGLLWASTFCRDAGFIIKADDDVFINTRQLDAFLGTTPRQSHIGCPILRNRKVERSPGYQYYASPEEYKAKNDRYPPYCAGWIIIYTPDVVTELYKQAQMHPYFWIDDIHMTGILAGSLGLSLSSLGDLALWAEETTQLLNNPRKDFLFALTLPTKFWHLWKMVNNAIS